MKGVPQGRYTREFRQEAVKLVTEERLSLPEAARRLSLAPSTLGYWVKAQRAGKLGDVGKTYRPLTEVVSLFSINVRLTVRQKCHLFGLRWYQMATLWMRPGTEASADSQRQRIS